MSINKKEAIETIDSLLNALDWWANSFPEGEGKDDGVYKQKAKQLISNLQESLDKDINIEIDTSAISIPDECFQVYCGGFENLPQLHRTKLSAYQIDKIFKEMVTPAINKARELDRAERNTFLVSTTQTQLSFLITQYFDLVTLGDSWVGDIKTRLEIAGKEEVFYTYEEVERKLKYTKYALIGYCNAMRVEP